MFTRITKGLCLCFVFTTIWTGAFAQQKVLNNDNLSKYSYLLYGDIYPAVKPYGIVKATGFFVNHQGKTYLVTANHVLTGWSGQAQANYFPKTWYVRLYKTNGKSFSFFPLDARNLLTRNVSLPYTQSPDVCLYEMKIPAGYQVYTINAFIKEIKNIAISSTLTTYGYPPHYSTSKAISLSLKPAGSAVTLLTSISPGYSIKLDNGNIDAVNYRTQHYRYEQVGPGYSGSPVFFKRNNEVFFAGIMAFGNSELAYVVKPYWLTKMLSQVKAPAPVH